MANAKKCDKCGKLYEFYDGYPVKEKGNLYNGVVLFRQNTSNSRKYDLCPSCMAELIVWIKEAGNDKTN